MWTVVYIARNKALADKIKGELESQGMMVALRPLGSEEKDGSVEVLVPESEIDEAHDVLTSIFAR